MAISGTGGTLNFIDNRPLVTGSFSGLDTAALIEAELTLRRLPAVNLENRISENDTKIAAFNELNSLLSSLGAATNGLRNPPGISGLDSNTFERKAAFLTSSSATAAPEILGVTVDNTAATGIHTIEVDQLALAHKISSGTIADPAAALGVTETLTIGLAGATAAEQFNLAVDAATSANDIVAAANTQTAVTGVRASVVKVADNDHRVIFTASDTNKSIELIGTTGTTTAALGISSDNGATYDNVLQAAQGARIFVDGITDPILRDDNEIGDVISGVTLDLFSAEPGTTITLEIEPDLTSARQQITDFVDAYNAVRTFLKDQQNVNSEGEVSETALLFGNNLVRTLGNSLGDDIATLVDGLPAAALSNLRDIGIELDADNFLTIDDAKLDAALVDKVDEVRGVFEFGFQSDSSRVNMVARNSRLDVGTFTINVPAGAIDGTNVQVDGADAFEVDGNILRGLAGTVYEGFSLAYVRDTSDPGEAAEDITVTTTLGIAERLFQTVESYVKPGEGLVVEEILRFEELNADYQDEIAAIDARLEFVQESLIAKYRALEQALAQADAISQQLQAFLKSGDN